MTMTEMLQTTFERRAKLEEKFGHEVLFCGEFFEVDGVGSIHCSIQVAQGAQTFMRAHFRRIWKLNGKRISAAKLQELVGA